jgi:hypothetical protein
MLLIFVSLKKKTMTVANLNSDVKTEISSKGYIHIKFPASINFEEIVSSLGEVIQKTEIRENPLSTKLLSSNQKMGFHTDHHAAKYIAWFCRSQSAWGGQSLLLDTYPVLEKFSKNSRSLLQEISVQTHRVFYNDKLSKPLLTIDEQGTSAIYYAEWLINNPISIKHQKALDVFEDEITKVKPREILLSEGDLLIIDNQRFLHGRTAFPEKSNRWLTRFWIKENTL